MREPTEMESRVARAICTERCIMGDEPCNSGQCSPEDSGPAKCHEWARAAIRSMTIDLEKMDGALINTICAAFDWPEDAGYFPMTEGLTAALVRAINSYVHAASPGDE